jgi:hypothetical protein
MPSGVCSMLMSPGNISKLRYIRRQTNTLNRFMFELAKS